MFKKVKLPAAIALLVQSVTFFVLFLILWAKKKSLASTFLAVSAMSGAASGFLICQMRKEIAETSVAFDDEFDVDEAEIKADLDHLDEEEALEN